jgi:hypothetical protein
MQEATHCFEVFDLNKSAVFALLIPGMKKGNPSARKIYRGMQIH